MYEFLDYQVQDVMTENPTTILPDARLSEAEAIFEEHDWNGLPVVDASGALVGFLTQLDLLRAFEFDEDHMFPPYEQIMQTEVARVMSRDVHTVAPRTPLTRVLTRMLHTRCKSMPVLDADDRLVGMVARHDVMTALRKATSGQRAPVDEKTS
jgi:CBS domain-containing protein